MCDASWCSPFSVRFGDGFDSGLRDSRSREHVEVWITTTGITVRELVHFGDKRRGQAALLHLTIRAAQQRTSSTPVVPAVALGSELVLVEDAVAVLVVDVLPQPKIGHVERE